MYSAVFGLLGDYGGDGHCDGAEATPLMSPSPLIVVATGPCVCDKPEIVTPPSLSK